MQVEEEKWIMTVRLSFSVLSFPSSSSRVDASERKRIFDDYSSSIYSTSICLDVSGKLEGLYIYVFFSFRFRTVLFWIGV